jgi:DnaJ-class molecular chaperone
VPIRDHYIVLGVPRDENPAGIRAAFRDLAKRHHPDRAGPEGTLRFREIADAYRVLGDAGARRAYDEKLRRSDAGARLARIQRRARPPAPDSFVDEPLDVFGEPQAFAGALLARFLGNFTTSGHPKSERAEPLICHVLLSQAEARAGGVLPIRVPVLERCASCGGSGHVWPFPCIDCNASGTIQRSAIVEVRVPSEVASGTRFTAALDGVGIRNLFLEVVVRVAPQR